MNTLLRTSFILFSFLLTTCLAGQAASFRVDITGEGDPIILIPGLGCDGSVWDATVEKLKNNYTCHVLTLPGFAGQPPLVDLDNWMSQVEKEVITYANTLSEQPIFIGHSLGGFLSLSIAAHQPELPKKVLIIDSYPFYSAAMLPGATEETAKPQADFMRKMMVNMPAADYATQQRQTMKIMAKDSGDIVRIADWSIASDRATVAEAMYELMTTDLRPEVSRTQCPITVLGAWYSAKDYGLTAESVGNNYREQFKGGKERITIEIAPTAFHFIMYDEPKWFQQQLTKFLK